jgi:hypothetical protein
MKTFFLHSYSVCGESLNLELERRLIVLYSGGYINDQLNVTSLMCHLK